MKLVFLDMDGVMNSLRTCAAYEGYGFPPREGKDFMRAELKLDPIAVHLLRRLCESTGAKIVISSTWRMGTPIEHFVKIFEAYGWPNAPVIGKTEQTSKGFRGDEVEMWMEANGATCTHHVILDDDGDFHAHQPLVKTKHSDGLSFENFTKASEILGIDDIWAHPITDSHA